jgi:hypothetical protein
MQVIDYTAVNDTFKAWVLGSSPSALTICFNDLRRNQQRASDAINQYETGPDHSGLFYWMAAGVPGFHFFGNEPRKTPCTT